jgi:uncharacterized membrane protein
MLKFAAAYLCTGLVFLILDGFFLTFVGMKLYKPDIGELLSGSVRAAPAVLFYLLYVFGLTWFCVWPSFGAGWSKALVAGLILGLVAYGTYDLTCQAVMKVWTWKVTLVDLAWGAFASAVASAAGVAITRALKLA